MDFVFGAKCNIHRVLLFTPLTFKSDRLPSSSLSSLPFAYLLWNSFACLTKITREQTTRAGEQTKKKKSSESIRRYTKGTYRTKRRRTEKKSGNEERKKIKYKIHQTWRHRSVFSRAIDSHFTLNHKFQCTFRTKRNVDSHIDDHARVVRTHSVVVVESFTRIVCGYKCECDCEHLLFRDDDSLIFPRTHFRFVEAAQCQKDNDDNVDSRHEVTK